MQSLGLIQADFQLTSGETTTNNIKRFHVTILGLEVLKYVRNNKT